MTDVNGQYSSPAWPPASYLVDVVESTLPDSARRSAAGPRRDDLSAWRQPVAGDQPRGRPALRGRRLRLPAARRHRRARRLRLVRRRRRRAAGCRARSASPASTSTSSGPARTTPTAPPATTRRSPPPPDVDGSYLFTGLPPGMYLATYDQADILALGLTNQPTNLGAGQRTFSLTRSPATCSRPSTSASTAAPSARSATRSGST